MIEKMRKYSFVLYHLDYESFLADLQKLGVVHLIKTSDAKTYHLIQTMELMEEYTESVKFLKKLNSEAEKTNSSQTARALSTKLNSAREERDRLLRLAETLHKQIKELAPWGYFDYSLEAKIESQGVMVDFYTCQKNHFKPEWQEEYSLEIINEVSGILYFVVFYTGECPILDADSFSFHQHTLQQSEENLAETDAMIKDIDDYLNGIAPIGIEILETEIKNLSQACEYEVATQQGTSEADEHLTVLSGWIPKRLESELLSFLDQKGIIHFASDATVEENPPISLTNNKFAKLFEPITRMYMLPYYNEFDLTPLFAPFFMLFFGFCNADIAYGIVFILIGLFLYKKAKNPAMKSLMLLVILFGGSAMVMGWVMGSILGFSLLETTLNKYIIIRDNNQIFNFALLLGAIQILFGIFVNAIKSARQSGIMYVIAPAGTFLFILGLCIMGAGMLGTDISQLKTYATYLIYAGLAMMMLFNQPGKNPIKNILAGLWLLYNVVGGFFGDILSYIRLFALGVSSAILGFVINSIGLQILHGNKILGPIIFVVFMLAGHALNIALGALSGFVHSLRLTFVEFFKNVGYNGPGLVYNPFGNKK